MDDYKCRCGGGLTPATKRIVTQGEDVIIIDGVPCDKCVACGQSYLTPQVTKHLSDLVIQVSMGRSLVAIRHIRYQEGQNNGTT